MTTIEDLIKRWQLRAQTLEDAADVMPEEDAIRLRVMSHDWDIAATELDEMSKED